MNAMNPSGTLVPAWSDQQKADFRKRSIAFEHRLRETGLFEDEVLVKLLDVYPAELYDINLFDMDDAGQHVLRTGVRGKTPGAEVLEAIKQGRVWMQFRGVQDHHAEIGSALRRLFAEISERIPGFDPVQLTGQLILSGPHAKVPFHVDAPGVILFHIRGRKRIWIYPDDEAHMPRRAMENIVLQQQTEELPYSRSMDGAAEVLDLDPGMAASWPLHCPHRIDNVEGVNVSLSVEYQTWPSRVLNGAYYANGVMRRWGLPVMPIDAMPGPMRVGLWGAHVLMKRSGVVKSKLKDYERSFELGDSSAATTTR